MSPGRNIISKKLILKKNQCNESVNKHIAQCRGVIWREFLWSDHGFLDLLSWLSPPHAIAVSWNLKLSGTFQPQRTTKCIFITDFQLPDITNMFCILREAVYSPAFIMSKLKSKQAVKPPSNIIEQAAR